MASQGQGFNESYTLSEDLRTKRFFLLKQGTTTNSALLNDSAGGQILGILQDIGLDGSTKVKHANVRTTGESKVILGASVTKGDPLQGNAIGKAITATTGDQIFGVALETGIIEQVINCQVSDAGIF